jgi:hypothetical protein
MAGGEVAAENGVTSPLTLRVSHPKVILSSAACGPPIPHPVVTAADSFSLSTSERSMFRDRCRPDVEVAPTIDLACYRHESETVNFLIPLLWGSYEWRGGRPNGVNRSSRE